MLRSRKSPSLIVKWFRSLQCSLQRRITVCIYLLYPLAGQAFYAVFPPIRCTSSEICKILKFRSHNSCRCLWPSFRFSSTAIFIEELWTSRVIFRKLIYNIHLQTNGMMCWSDGNTRYFCAAQTVAPLQTNLWIQWSMHGKNLKPFLQMNFWYYWWKAQMFNNNKPHKLIHQIIMLTFIGDICNSNILWTRRTRAWARYSSCTAYFENVFLYLKNVAPNFITLRTVHT